MNDKPKTRRSLETFYKFSTVLLFFIILLALIGSCTYTVNNSCHWVKPVDGVLVVDELPVRTLGPFPGGQPCYWIEVE